MRSYTSARKRYLAFCDLYGLSPLPLSERVVCLFTAYLAQQGLAPRSISSYLAALRHLQISAGLEPVLRSSWPRLQYVLRGIKRSCDASPARVRLPVTAEIMRRLQHVWSGWTAEKGYEARLLWAACCMGYFGFMRAGEFTTVPGSPPAILASDVAVNSHSDPSVLRVHLRHSKTDPFGDGVSIFLGRTNSSLCPVAAILQFLAVRPPGEGPLFVWGDKSPLSRERFVLKVKEALSAAQLDHHMYSGHSFRIGAATSAATAGVPAYLIKMLGRWSSEAYQLYIRTPRETLSGISRSLV